MKKTSPKTAIEMEAFMAKCAVEDALSRAAHAAEAAYTALIVDLVEIESRPAVKAAAAAIGELSAYLCDSNVDAENCERHEPGTLVYWECMYRSAAMAAGGRAEEYKLDINALIGRVIY
jgi:hypothetical protein